MRISDWSSDVCSSDLLKKIKAAWALGGDFAMRQDRADYAFGYTAENLARHVPLIVELRECPYDQQKQAVFWISDQLGIQSGVLDANGNGMVLAQEARQKFGPDRIVERSEGHTSELQSLMRTS